MRRFNMRVDDLVGTERHIRVYKEAPGFRLGPRTWWALSVRSYEGADRDEDNGLEQRAEADHVLGPQLRIYTKT
jgi:hypothetical protein